MKKAGVWLAKEGRNAASCGNSAAWPKIFYGNRRSKAQGAGEFVLILGIIIVFVSTVMVIGFRQTEISLAVSVVRIGANEFVSAHPGYVLTSIDYAVDEQARKVGVYPLVILGNGSRISGGLNDSLSQDSVVKNSLEGLRRVFNPKEEQALSGNCFPASYYSYCVAPSG